MYYDDFQSTLGAQEVFTVFLLNPIGPGKVQNFAAIDENSLFLTYIRPKIQKKKSLKVSDAQVMYYDDVQSTLGAQQVFAVLLLKNYVKNRLFLTIAAKFCTFPGTIGFNRKIANTS